MEATVSQNNDTHCHDQIDADGCEVRLPRIGLALSGGGFRASIFHLGVIRRLEELGIMKYVHTISAVSGGSIIAAYYVIEMEKRLRHRREEMASESKDKLKQLDQVRIEIFEKIAGCFFQALDHNLRSRALLFSPFYHPLLFIKSWWPGFSRSDIMQKEFDRWFYHDATLDDFPSVTFPHDGASSEEEKTCLVLTGPTVVLNTTSLLKGERKGFKREPVSHLSELHRRNQNVLKLSRIVGASSGVPGVFPPTTILGDKFVDGGVADNQGIDALVSLDRFLDGQNGGERAQSPKKEECRKKDETSCNEGIPAVPDDFDFLLVSDASGQMEVKHRLGIRSVKVLSRVMSIFQFQLRRKILRILRWWKKSAPGRCDCRVADVDCEGCHCREFAFVHLFLNLKGRPYEPPRVLSEYIPALGRIRTDLDQFSPIEREALMYHGYTLIDAEIPRYCEKLKTLISGKTLKLKRPPLFRDQTDSSQCSDPCTSESRLRERVKDVLTAGSDRVFLIRSWRKYPGKSWWVFGPALAVFLGGYNTTVQSWLESLRDCILPLRPVRWLSSVISDSIPDPVRWVWTLIVENCSLPWDTQVLKSLAWNFFWVYLVLFLTFCVMRRVVRRWDLEDYQLLTGQEPTIHW